MPMSNQTWIPVELAHKVKLDGIVPEFKVLVTAKIITPGYFSLKDNNYRKLYRYLGYESRTVNKHLQHLLRLGWVGIDGSRQMYYLRSWEWFYENSVFTDHRAVLFKEDDIESFNAFLAGAIIGNQVLKHDHYCRIQERKLNRSEKLHLSIQRKRKPKRSVVRNIGSTTLQDQSVSSTAVYQRPPYFGLSNYRLSQMLNCSESYARKLKHEAKFWGYIKTIPHRLVVADLSTYNNTIRSEYYKIHGDQFAKKLRFWSEVQNGRKVIQLVQQLHDEIIPLMSFRQVNYQKQIFRKQNRDKQAQFLKQFSQLILRPQSQKNPLPVLIDCF